MAPGEDDVRVVASARGAGRGRGPSAGLAVAVVVALLAGLLIGNLTAGGDDDGKSSPNGRAGARPGPARSVDGVPTGYARTRGGAVAATVNYGAVIAGPAFLDPAKRRAVLAVMASPEYAREVERNSAPGLAQLQRGPVGQGLRRGAPTLFKAAPIGYRVVRFSAQEAVVEVWGLALIGNATTLQPQASFGTTTSTLRWTAGDWKFVASRSTDGPTPALAPGAKRTPAQRFLDATEQLHAFRYEP